MKRYMLFFISMVVIIFIGYKEGRYEVVASSGHPTVPIVLQSKYDENTNHVKEKKMLKREIKNLDTVVHTQFDHLKEWVSNVGEALEMMK